MASFKHCTCNSQIQNKAFILCLAMMYRKKKECFKENYQSRKLICLLMGKDVSLCGRLTIILIARDIMAESSAKPMNEGSTKISVKNNRIGEERQTNRVMPSHSEWRLVDPHRVRYLERNTCRVKRRPREGLISPLSFPPSRRGETWRNPHIHGRVRRTEAHTWRLYEIRRLTPNES